MSISLIEFTVSKNCVGVICVNNVRAKLLRMAGDDLPALQVPMDMSKKTALILHRYNLSRRGTLHVGGENLCDLPGSSHRQHQGEADQNNN